MEHLKLTIGISPHNTRKRHLQGLTAFRQHIYDLHFPHYNPHISASGRRVNSKISLDDARKKTLDLISWNNQHTGFKLTLLLNYLLHDNYQAVVGNVCKEFYPRGVRSFVVADIELIKRLKDVLPDCEIQGSCLSHRMTEEELEEERKAGVVLHNPSVNIIRNPAQLERNHQAGFAQKIIALEGCLHNCPDASATYGHFWHLARSLRQNQVFCKNPAVSLDPRFLFKANWVTVSRLKTLMPFISVVKLPRGQQASALAVVKKFMHIFNTDASYNIVDFINSGYYSVIAEKIGKIPSHLFDDDFFTTVENCTMDCSERSCNLCYDMMEKIKAVNGGPIPPGIFLKSYRHLKNIIETTKDGDA